MLQTKAGIDAFLLLFALESEGIHPHLLHHCEQAIGARWRQVFLQAYLFDEVKVSIQYLVGSMT
jgi:hypothetical protein